MPPPLIGGSPVLSPPAFGSAPPARTFAAPFASNPPPRPAQAPPPKVRAQSPEEPKPAARSTPLVMPTPEQLGIGSSARPAPAAADWSAARRRLELLGASCFQLEKRPAGGYRFVCLLPTAQPGRSHRIEAEADTEAEAVRVALERAEQWARRK